MTPIESLLGMRGSDPKCRVISDQISVHWFPIGAGQGAKCLCGATTKDADEDVAIERPNLIDELLANVPDHQLGETRCNCPESGTSGSCPFHDASTIREG